MRIIGQLRDRLISPAVDSGRTVSIGRAVYRPLWWQARGRSETASGYGRRLRSEYVLYLIGDLRPRRIYITQFSNAGTAWIVYRGDAFIVSECDFDRES